MAQDTRRPWSPVSELDRREAASLGQEGLNTFRQFDVRSGRGSRAHVVGDAGFRTDCIGCDRPGLESRRGRCGEIVVGCGELRAVQGETL